MSGLAAAALEGETLEVSHGAISNLQSPGRLLGKEWAINKGLPGSKKSAEGLRLQLQREQMEESKEVCYWALGPAPFPAVL